ncbi:MULTISPECIES: hypothetical protein [Nocardiaceae]|uniref:hypothetical protein n=1 Tax=Nocardiaceae TaxID=85025 RepID=UPI00113FE9C8|nr:MULTISPECIES: hypothetical protein [Rhodococcus]
MTHKDDVPFVERTGSDLNEAATKSLIKDTSRNREVDYEVSCPTCLGKVQVTEYTGGTFRTTAVSDSEIDISNPQAPWPGAQHVLVVAMQCGCGIRHPGAPQGVTGCGSLWVVPE